MVRYLARWLIVISFLLLAACAPPPFGAARTPSSTPVPASSPQATARPTPEPTRVPSPVPSPGGEHIASLPEILQAPERFRDQFVRLEGRGVIMATLPLCPGYVGLDERQRFVDAEGQMIVATIAFTWPEGLRMYDAETVRLFEGYIRIFQGPIGCPGSTQERTVPYFEIRGVELKR